MNGKIALVTGGSTGVGLATAQAFAREGATVIIASRNEKRAKQALTALADDGRGSWTECDVTDGRNVDRLISSLLKEHGQADYTFNNTGSGGNVSDSEHELGCMAQDYQRLSYIRFSQSERCEAGKKALRVKPLSADPEMDEYAD